jgi:uncharacterized protein
MNNSQKSALLFSVAIIVAAFLLGNAYKEKYITKGTITVTGLGEKSFTSDLIVWEGEFVKENMELKSAYSELEKDKKIVLDYLKNKGVKENEIIFKAVNTREKRKSVFTPDGNYAGEKFDGYILSIAVQITSGDIDKIEDVSRSITELLNMGIQFYSYPPRYYYTKLSDLKIELLADATEDAKNRIETITKMSGVKIDKLRDAQMGVYQILGENSNEDFSWGGTFNTDSKNKKASVTVKLVYKTK